MATYEHDSLTQVKDAQGDLHIIYPITKAENVDGLEDAIQEAAGGAQEGLAAHLGDHENPHHVTAEQVGADPKGTAASAAAAHNTSAAAHADIRQAVTEARTAAQQAAAAVQNDLDSHTGNKNNPHNVTKAQVGLGRVDNTSDADKPLSSAAQNAMAQLSDALDKVAGMTLLGGGAGGGELEDTALEIGSFLNAGAGWNTFQFREAFEGVPQVLCQAENFDGIVQVRSITAEGFLYCLRTLSTGSYYTGTSAGTQPSHSASTLVNGSTTTAAAITIHYIAAEYGGER